MNLYGSDKPDLRFGLEMKDFAPFAKKGSFEVFKKVVEGGGVVKALVAPGCGEYSRKQITRPGGGGEGLRRRRAWPG